MANRIVNNVIILDATGVVPFPGTGRHMDMNGISFWSSNSTGLLEIALTSSTSDVVLKLGNPVDKSATVWGNFATPQSFAGLTVNTITAGTAWIYMA